MTNYYAGVASSGAGVALSIVLNPYAMLPITSESIASEHQTDASSSHIFSGPSQSASVRFFNSESSELVGLTAIARDISKFYKNLLDEQVSLGSDFERVLDENLWDLYER